MGILEILIDDLPSFVPFVFKMAAYGTAKGRNYSAPITRAANSHPPKNDFINHDLAPVIKHDTKMTVKWAMLDFCRNRYRYFCVTYLNPHLTGNDYAGTTIFRGRHQLQKD